MLETFWQWYEKRFRIIAPLTALLFLLQAVHLFWLTTNVVFPRAIGYSLWDPGRVWDAIIALVDYTEIPAIISSSIFYVHQYKNAVGEKWRSVIFLLLINSQWLHLLWITDEVVVAQFTGVATILLPTWLSWFAIIIDYLEIPVMYDTTKKAIISLSTNKG